MARKLRVEHPGTIGHVEKSLRFWRFAARSGEAKKAPTSKHQAPEKLQEPNFKMLRGWFGA
jgi:hypothetical protein